MTKTLLEDGTLRISSYDGNSGKRATLSNPSSDSLQRWNFFRLYDNCAYVKGTVNYVGDCENNVVISPYRHNQLINVKNAFISVKNNHVEISPITDIETAIIRGKELLSGKEISYNLPQTVHEREDLVKFDLEGLKEEIVRKYGIEPQDISVINSGRTKRGVYFVKGKSDQDYVLKFKGRDKERSELLSRMSEEIPDYFPKNFHRKDNNEFTFELNEELYGLEEFVRNISPKVRNQEYFCLIGNHMSILHKSFSDFIKRNGMNKGLISIGMHASESNLISTYLDLLAPSYVYLLSQLERIIEGRLSGRMNSLPNMLIHRDLNQSNLIWNGDNPKIVDSETIKYSVRLTEFGAPLFFEGGMVKPKYMRNSLKSIVYGYNQSTEMPLSQEEEKVLPLLLKYLLIKNFVVRKIRRGLDDENFVNELKRNLNILEEDSK